MTRRLTVEADGGSRGNPGVAGYGALVRDGDTGALLAERAEPLGKASNNVAEYRGLIAGLEAALAIDPGAHVLARMDSKLVVEQMSGRWKIKHEDMRRLALQARDVAAQIMAAGGAVRYEWIPREINKDADALSNVAMDGHTVDRDVRRFAGCRGGRRCGGGGPRGGRSRSRRSTGIPVRVVLVAAAATEAGAGATASAVASLVGGRRLRVVRAGTDAVSPTAAAVGDCPGHRARGRPGVGRRRPRRGGRVGPRGGRKAEPSSSCARPRSCVGSSRTCSGSRPPVASASPWRPAPSRASRRGTTDASRWRSPTAPETPCRPTRRPGIRSCA